MNDKYTEIDGKFYQEVDVVLLPTKNKAISEIGILPIKGLSYSKTWVKEFGFNPQHLYFLSDEEIKEDDWKLEGFVYAGAKVIQHKGDTIKSESGDNGFEVKKIIATTDSELGEHDSITISQGRFNNTYPTFKPLARPSNSFIEKFISQWNKGNKIDKVLVECRYDSGYSGKTVIGHLPNGSSTTIGNYNPQYLLKIAPDNTITIKPLVVKDSYSREEMENLLSNYGVDVLYAANNKQAIPYYIDWLKKQNL